MLYESFLNSHIVNSTHTALRLSVANRIDMLNDNFESAVMEELAHQFHPNNASRMRQMVTTENNVFTRVMKKISRVYLETPVRRALVASVGGSQSYDSVYDDVIAASNIAHIMPQVNLLTNACNEALVKASWRGGRIEYDIITLDRADIVVDDNDPLVIRAIAYRCGGKYIVWNSDGTVTTTVDGEVIRRDAALYLKPNNTPLMPFVLFHKEYPYSQLVNYSKGADLYMFTVEINVLLTYVNYLIKMQTYKQPYIIGEKVAIPNEMIWDAARLQIFEGENVSAGMFDLQADIRALWDVLQARIVAVAANYDIAPENFTLSGTPSSGFALKLSNRGLDDMLKKDRQMYKLGERELFEVTRIVNNYHNPNKIDVNARFMIDFAEPRYDESPAVDDAHWETLIRHNVKTRADWVAAENPDLSRDDALALIRQNARKTPQMPKIILPSTGI